MARNRRPKPDFGQKPGFQEVVVNPDDVVLAALVNSPRDLEIALTERWYRIPTRHAPKHFSGAQYLAFYLPASFGARKWTIDTYAEVRGHELARRRDLLPQELDHPRADELYYKLQLGESAARVPAIYSKRGRRILFLWTNWEKFSNAVEWNDLYLRSPAHEQLYDALRGEHFDVEREVFVSEGRSRYRVDFMIYLPGGSMTINVGEQAAQLRSSNRIGLTVRQQDIQDHPARLREMIERAARELGAVYGERTAA